MPNFTKGEWKAKGQRILAIDERNEIIAVTHYQSMEPRGMAEANAHLISAAPDMCMKHYSKCSTYLTETCQKGL